MSAEFIAVGMFAGLLIGLFLGHPLAFVLGGLAVIFGYFGWGPSCFFMFVNQTFGVMDNYILWLSLSLYSWPSCWTSRA